jgi:serine/threonine protein kinase
MPHSFEDTVLGQVLNGKYRLQRIRLRGVFSVTFAAEEFFCRTFVRGVLVQVSRQTGITDVTGPHFFGDALRLAQLPADDALARRPQLPAILELGLLPHWNACGALVTEADEGTPLLAWQPDGQRPDLARQLSVFQSLCELLAVLHAHSIAHRELRPEAVVIDAAGTARLLGLGLSVVAEPAQAAVEAPPELLAHLAPEVLRGQAGPAADVYGLGLMLYEWLTGGGAHLTAPWGSATVRGGADLARLKRSLRFPPPSVLRGEIRASVPWLDELVLRCLEPEPAERFRDAGQLLAALAECAGGRPLPPLEPAAPETARPPVQPRRGDDPGDALIREARRLIARGEFDRAIDTLDVHRPAEWAVVDHHGARILRVLGQAYVRRGDWRAGKECLEQLRAVQREQRLLPPPQYASALTDLRRCCAALGLNDVAEAVSQEAQEQLQGAHQAPGQVPRNA